LTYYYYHAELAKGGELKELEDYKKLRQNPECFKQLCDEFMPCVVGRSKWCAESYHKELSQIATATDEAWVLLVLENSWDLWKQMAEWESRKEVLPKEERKATKWTAGATSAVRYEGWGAAGLQAYNEIVDQVREDRAARGRDFNKSFLTYKKEEREKMRSGKKRRRDESQDDQLTLVNIANDASVLSDVEEDFNGGLTTARATDMLGV